MSDAWVITGPTAVGKTELVLQIAERENLEIVSMDSMAVYRRMDIGTAKPSAEERARVPHHLIDVVDPSEPFDTATWCELAQQQLDAARSAGRGLLFAGGTPLYLMAFFKGMLDGPQANPEIRQRLEAEEREAPGTLHDRLRDVDRAAADKIHRHDLRRLVRALEVFELTGKPISEQQTTFESDTWRIPCRILVLERDRDELRDRVKHRTEAMLANGLLEETRAIRDGEGFSKTAGGAIGYAECLRHLDRPFKDDEELRNRIRRSTHRLIRRQTTWIRRLHDVSRMHPDQGLDAAMRHLQDG